MTPFSFSPADTLPAFAIFGLFWFLVAGATAGGFALWRPALRLWFPAALVLIGLFVGVRALSYHAALFGADQPDWPSFYGAYLNDPTAHPSLVLFTTKLGIGVAARMAEWGLAHLGIAQISPPFMVSGRFSAIGFDLLLTALLCGVAWRMAPVQGRSMVVLSLFTAMALVPAHIYMSTTISYNLIGDVCLILVLLADLACYRAICDMIAAVKDDKGAGTDWFALLLRTGLSVIAFGLSLTLLLGAKWLIPPVLAIFAAQVSFAILSGCCGPGAQGQRKLVLLIIAWTFGSMLMFTAATYFLVTAPKLLGSGEHFSNNFAFFAQAISVKPVTELGIRIKTLMFELMAPNIGYVAVLLAPFGIMATTINGIKHKNQNIILINVWSTAVVAQSVISNFTTMTSDFSSDGLASMTRNTLLMSILLLYALLACPYIGLVVKGRGGKLLALSMIGLVTLEVGLGGVAYTAFAISDRPLTRLAAKLEQMPAGTAIGTISSSENWCLPFTTQVRTTLRPLWRIEGPDDQGERPIYWIRASCDSVGRQWMNLLPNDQEIRDRLLRADYHPVDRYEAGPAIFNTRLSPLLTQGKLFGLFQPSWIELWEVRR